MFSKRSAICRPYFQADLVKEEKSEASATITKMESLINELHQALHKMKFQLCVLKAEITDARLQERHKEPGLFFSGVNKTQQVYRHLEAQIEKQERTKTLLQVNLKKLRNEEIDEELQEKAERYTQIERINLVSIYQFA
jgi:hypothetical protein